MRGLILGLTAMLVGFPLMGWGYFLTHMAPDGHTDFRPAYTAGYMLRAGKPLYDPAAQLEAQNRVVSREEIALPFNHPAYEALIYLPLSFFSYFKAYCLWFALNLLMLASIYYVLRAELAPLSAVAPWLPIVSLAAYLPFGVTLMQGQDSVLCTLLFALAFGLLRSEDNLLIAGGFMGLAAFRFQILIPVVVCFLFWRRWKLMLGLLCTGLPAVLISVLLGGVRPYVEMLLKYSGQGTVGGAVEPLGLNHLVWHMPNLRGLIQALGGGPWLIGFASLLVLAIAILVGRELDDRPGQLALAISAASLISYHGLVHDLSVLFVPCAFLFSRWATTASAPLIAAIVFVSPNLLIFAPDHFYFAACGGLVLFGYLAASSRLYRQVSDPPPLEAGPAV